jgi:hypothetical protein
MWVLVLLLSSSSFAEMLSMTAGRVGDHILTSREVNMDAAMEKVLYKGMRLSAVRLEPVDSKAFFNETNDAILERSLATEAKNFDVVKVNAAELRDLQARFGKALKSIPGWKSMEPTASEWTSILERKLRAKMFIKFRKESSDLPVTDNEAKKYYEENHLKYGNLPFDNFKADIKAFLARSQVDRRLKDWYEVIKSKYNAKNFLAEP